MVKASIALSTIAFIGRFILNRIFFVVARSKSQEAFLSLILLTVTGMSILTEGLGLSNTLGAFLAGVLLSETKYRYQVEADIVPFRGLLLGLFFITVGFSIDIGLLVSQFPKIMAMVSGVIVVKASIITALALAFKLSISQALQAGVVLAQGGEFAFVAFGLAQRLGILSGQESKLLLTTTAISMAATPLLTELGAKVASKIESRAGYSHYVGQDTDSQELVKGDQGELVVVCGYGRIGRVVCEVLDRKFIRYIVFEVNPQKAIEARNRDLPVFFGDVSRPEVLKNFDIGAAKMVITTISDIHTANTVVVALKRMYPKVPILARAVDENHQKRLESTLDVMAVVPVLPEDALLMNLPFGGAVLKGLGYPKQEVEGILMEIRKKAESDNEKGAVVDVIGEKKVEEETEKKKKETEKAAIKAAITSSMDTKEGPEGYVTKSIALKEPTDTSFGESEAASSDPVEGDVPVAAMAASIDAAIAEGGGIGGGPTRAQ